MINSILKILNDNDFAAHKISYDDITMNSPLSILKQHDINNDSANLLKYFPNLFVVHRSFIPEKGIFFILVQNNKTIDLNRMKIYKKYFPRRIAVVFKKDDDYYANWYNEDNSIPFVNFLKKATK